MRILVTGGAGFIGSNLVEALMRRGHECTVLDVKEHPGCTIMDKQLVDNAVDKCDLVYHLASASSCDWFKYPIHSCIVNNQGTLNVVDACSRFGKKIIFAASGGAYLDEETPRINNFYSATKIFNEHTIQIYSLQFGLDYAIMRFSSVYGDDHSRYPFCGIVTQFIDKLKSNEAPVIYGDGKQTRDFVYVKDVVNALVLAITLPNDIYQVSSNKATSFIELASICSRALNKSICPRFMELDRSVHPSYIMQQKIDNSRLMGFGWKPEYSLEEGIRDAYL